MKSRESIRGIVILEIKRPLSRRAEIAIIFVIVQAEVRTIYKLVEDI